MTILPVIISIPHGGKTIPSELKENFRLNELDVLYDGDTWSDLLYNFEKRVLHTALMPIARSVIDLNRMEVDLPPNNPDGLVKIHSIMSVPVWKRPLSVMEVKSLLTMYYYPYYEALQSSVVLKKPQIGFDCHTMLANDPFNTTRTKRPLICISNRGGLHGEALDTATTAPQALMLRFKTLLEKQFGVGNVLINSPFKGGELIRRMHEITQIPWIQIEVNRALYMPERKLLTTKPDTQALLKMREINQKLYLAFEALLFPKDTLNESIISSQKEPSEY